MPPPTPTDRHPECMYHGCKHRANYNQIVNLLRDRTDPKKPALTNLASFNIPKRYNRKVSKAVCICKGGQQDVSSKLAGVKEEIEKQLLADPTLKPLYATIRRYIDKVETKGKKPKENLVKMQDRSSSQLKFFQILLDAKQGKYEILEHLPKKQVAPVAAAGENPNRQTIELDLKQQYLGLLIGKKGANLKPIKDECEVSITIVQPDRTKNPGLTSQFPDMTNKDVIRLILMGNDINNLAKAKERLMKRARDINENRKIMTERTEKWKEEAPERKKKFKAMKEEAKKKKEAEEAAAMEVPEEKLTTAVQPSGE